MSRFRNLCVFCGANAGAHPAFAEAAQALGQELVRRDIGLVYGAGSIGLMGIVARTVSDGGGRVLGIIPAALKTREIAGEIIGDVIVVDSMHERKVLMAEQSDGFVTLPGGFGTLDELFEAVTWGQLGIYAKPVGLYNVLGYFDPLLDWVERAIEQGFVRDRHRDLLVVGQSAENLLDRLEEHRMPKAVVNWIGPDQI